ncbi:MAG: hypothetical protein HYU04_01530 [Candidatus Wildermuthbacteria bacterium]|nr:hypothetical protein [Candidatus Wildermuthbacteria bacterium]
MVSQILFQFAESFWDILGLVLGFALRFTIAWWWLFLPFILLRPAIYFWMWWRSDELFSSQQRFTFVEIKMPQDVQKPIKAMEDVFSGLWQMHDPANPREKWLEGKYQLNLCLELVSTEGAVHFYMRIPEGGKQLLEASLYSHYPTAEIQVVEDYTKQIPRDIPNKEWELWGTNYILEKPSPYPIKTYSKFFEPSPEGEEERRIDPISHLIEGFSTLGKGEHLWIQFILWPVLHTDPHESDLVKQGTDIVAELVRRKVPAKPAGAFGGIEKDFAAVGTTLITGQAPVVTKAEEKDLFPPEMKLTPGEREIVTAIEEKISKYAFRVSARFVYIARRENYFGPAKTLAMSYFTMFSTATYNNFRPFRKTLTKTYTVLTWFLDKRSVFVKKRRLMRSYTMRIPAFYPYSQGLFFLNIEELATIFHFPGKMVAPSGAVPRVEAKKGEAPPGLPTE